MAATSWIAAALRGDAWLFCPIPSRAFSAPCYGLQAALLSIAVNRLLMSEQMALLTLPLALARPTYAASWQRKPKPTVSRRQREPESEVRLSVYGDRIGAGNPLSAPPHARAPPPPKALCDLAPTARGLHGASNETAEGPVTLSTGRA